MWRAPEIQSRFLAGTSATHGGGTKSQVEAPGDGRCPDSARKAGHRCMPARRCCKGRADRQHGGVSVSASAGGRSEGQVTRLPPPRWSGIPAWRTVDRSAALSLGVGLTNTRAAEFATGDLSWHRRHGGDFSGRMLSWRLSTRTDWAPGDCGPAPEKLILADLASARLALAPGSRRCCPAFTGRRALRVEHRTLKSTGSGWPSTAPRLHARGFSARGAFRGPALVSVPTSPAGERLPAP